MTNHSFGPLSSLSPSSLRPSAASTPPPSPPMDLATPPPTPPIDLATPPSSPLIESPHQASVSPDAIPPTPASSPQGWNSPSHPQLATNGWQSPDPSPSSTAISGASLWAMGDPVCRALFRESEDIEPLPADNDEAASLLPTAVFELIKLTLKFLVNSLIQKHREDVCQG
ncbi:classical arabinogalactan protein 9-like, partial [Pundamilia nyererei]|uniref:Classical arabinogalactan protein 9-like n=1 Tax=Pundamilia nyererei TaxID=303518 RepID=A0A9Y6J8N6_9CICH